MSRCGAGSGESAGGQATRACHDCRQIVAQLLTPPHPPTHPPTTHAHKQTHTHAQPATHVEELVPRIYFCVGQDGNAVVAVDSEDPAVAAERAQRTQGAR
jgi:hypothetical protein